MPSDKALQKERYSPGAPRGQAQLDLDSLADPDMTILCHSRRPPPPLPLAVFGAAWADWIKSAADAAAAPPDYVAAPLLAAASALIGHARWAQATPLMRAFYINGFAKLLWRRV